MPKPFSARFPGANPQAERLVLPHAGQMLGTGDETVFGAFARLAARDLEAPFGLVIVRENGRLQIRAAFGPSNGQALPISVIRAQMSSQRRVTLDVGDLAHDTGFAAAGVEERAAGFGAYAGATLRDESGASVGVVCVLDAQPRRFTRDSLAALTDLGRCASAMLILEPKAATDSSAAASVTGLPGREALEQHIDKLVAAAEATAPNALPPGFAILRIDIARLSALNDMHGRGAVDQSLKQVVTRLRAVAPSHSFLARLGGGGFALVLGGRVSPAEIEAVALRVMDRLREAAHVDGLDLPLRPAAGVATFPTDASDTLGLLRCAEAALSQAKREGDGRHVHCTPELLRTYVVSAGLEEDLQRATMIGAFALNWLPVIDTATEQVVSFEALVRWDRPGHGDISPDLFIPCAEATGLIEQIDSWVMMAACHEAQTWERALGVSVNVSPVWVSHNRLPALVRRVLDETGLDPARLQIELSERVPFGSDGMARRELARVRAMGVRLALDDFGTGYSCLGMLGTYPFDQVKLDRQFVSALGRDRRAEAITRSVLQMVQSLGMTSCAEGVETEEQLAFLDAHGCEEIQGYLIGRPIPTLPRPVGAAPEP
ncbi:putative bifunctional diguanylate cyclase/phosphodiesterase [Lichenicoccus sp.]|uniref:putative bifunctional diguanylate cyclase/phosphodiesterase n=1 Tax=Lichenicoccus sp. TaxID=2781899 RepID=UPI003D1432D8